MTHIAYTHFTRKLILYDYENCEKNKTYINYWRFKKS